MGIINYSNIAKKLGLEEYNFHVWGIVSYKDFRGDNYRRCVTLKDLKKFLFTNTYIDKVTILYTNHKTIEENLVEMEVKDVLTTL